MKIFSDWRSGIILALPFLIDKIIGLFKNKDKEQAEEQGISLQEIKLYCKLYCNKKKEDPSCLFYKYNKCQDRVKK